MNNRRKIKLLFGFNQTYKLNRFIKEIERKNKNKRRFSKMDGLINLIERRLDLILFRAGFVISLPQARQLISHKQIFVNGTAVTSSFYILSKADIVSISPNIKKIVTANIKQNASKETPFVSQYKSFEVNYNIQKIVIVKENQKTNEFFSLNKQDLNLLFTKGL